MLSKSPWTAVHQKVYGPNQAEYWQLLKGASPTLNKMPNTKSAFSEEQRPTTQLSTPETQGTDLKTFYLGNKYNYWNNDIRQERM